MNALLSSFFPVVLAESEAAPGARLSLRARSDLAPLGEGRCTNLKGVTVILWRDGEDRFRLDVWHSFAAYLLHLLETGCRELAGIGISRVVATVSAISVSSVLL